MPGAYRAPPQPEPRITSLGLPVEVGKGEAFA